MTGRQEAADFLAWRKKADSGDGWQDAPLGPINLR